MKKMPCLFVREFSGNHAFKLTDAVTPGCEWVLAGEGVATRKWDGAACLVSAGKLYKRFDAKKNPKTGEYRIPPEGATPCDEADSITGHWPHWIRVGDEPESKWHKAAWDSVGADLVDGTYEIVGVHFAKHEHWNSKPFTFDVFRRHGDVRCEPNRTFVGLREFLEDNVIEGLVFHHPDGRMCKIRRADYGLSWGSKLAHALVERV